MKTFKQIVEEARQQVAELMPWDVEELCRHQPEVLLLDVREECEFASFHIANSMLVPRGILETACEAEYEDAIPELIAAREREIVVICRSGNRSVLAAQTLQALGYQHVKSMQTGLRGWNDYELPLINASQAVLDPEQVDLLLSKGFSSEILQADRRLQS